MNLHLTELEWVTLITFGVPLVGNFITNILNHFKIGEVKASVKEYKTEVDGRLTQLLLLTQQAAEAVGVKKEQERVKGEFDDRSNTNPIVEP